MGLFIPRIGKLKSSSGRAPRPDMRRYSHLKLMISYMLGSGALAGKLSFYQKYYLFFGSGIILHSVVPNCYIIFSKKKNFAKRKDFL